MNVIDYIIKQRNEYETHSIELPGGGEFSQSDMIARDNKNWRSEYYQTQEDNVIGKYPYDNIVKPIILLEARATDFDIKHIEIEPKKQNRRSRLSAMYATKALHKYARKHHLARLFNQICITRPKYGGVLVKRNQDGIEVVPWENVITDQMEIETGVIIERHYYTPAELKRQKGWDNIDEAIFAAEDSKEADVDHTAKDNITQGNFIEVFELHGEVPVSMYKDAKGEDYEEEDRHEYMRVMIVSTASTDDEGNSNGTILYVEKEKESPYMYLARNPQVGRAIGESVYETLREHQKWHNYSKTEEARMMALAGKMLYITNQPDAMTNIFNGKVDHGTVLKLGEDAAGNPNFFKQLNQVPQGTPVYQNMREEIGASARSITSAHPAKLGEEAKAGTPFRAQYLQNIESSSQFEQYRKEIGEYLIRPMIEKWILPDAIKEMLSEDCIYSTFSAQELDMLDEVITNKAMNRAYVENLLKGKPNTQEDLEEAMAFTQKELVRLGNKRMIEKIKDFFEDAAGDVVIHVTDEMRNKAVLFESYANLLNVLAPEDPRRNAVIDRIMDSIGVTTEELQLYAAQANPMQQLAQPQPAQAKPNVENEQMAAAQKVATPGAVSAI